MYRLKSCLITKDCNIIKYVSVIIVRTKWEGVVGLEVHAQLQTKSKLFSAAGTSFDAAVNNAVSFFDAAIPGTLPVLNKECVRKGILSALALNCKIHGSSWFDRKHYFYADLPAGYQITQQRAPFATNGFLEFQVIHNKNMNVPYLKKTKIKQIQLEQDSGKSLHDVDHNVSYVDLNRAGNPLIEIVFEPDLKDGEEAACLVKELILILRKLETCSCKIEEGALRVDANVSVRQAGDSNLGVRSEIKNIGGINSITKAVNFEINRQTRLRINGKPIRNETLSWDATNQRTVSMRDKEIEQDYRFMPEPNLPPLRVALEYDDNSHEINVAQLRKELPELPATTRQNIMDKYGLTITTVIRLLNEPILLSLFVSIMEENSDRNVKKVSDFLMIDLLASLNKFRIPPNECKVTSSAIGQLLDILHDGLINRIIAITVLEELVQGNKLSPLEIVEKNQWYQINDLDILEESCKLVVEYEDELVDEYRRAKKKYKDMCFQKIVNVVLANTHQRANVAVVKDLLKKMLDQVNK